MKLLSAIDRIAASWLDYRTRKEIERRDKSEAVDDVELLDFQVSRERGAEILLSHPNFAFLAQELVSLLQSQDAPNFIQMEVLPRLDRGQRAIILTVAYKDGEMPAVQNARLKREIEELKARLEDMRSEARVFFWNMNDELDSEVKWAKHYANHAQDLRDGIADLLQYRDMNAHNFQLEKADDFLNRLRELLEKQP